MHPSKQMQLIWNFVDVMFMFIYKVLFQGNLQEFC